MKRTATLIAAAVLLAISVCSAGAYSGSLSSSTSPTKGIEGTGSWISPGPTSLWWSVTEDPGGWWNYSYRLKTPRYSISNLIVEVSNSFTLNDVISGSLTGAATSIDVDWYTPSGFSSALSGDIHGLKLTLVTPTADATFGFSSYRSPVWGDFFARGSVVTNTAYNHGFAAQDADDGFHIMVPDTSYSMPVPIVPEFSSLMLALPALAGLGVLRRRRN